MVSPRSSPPAPEQSERPNRSPAPEPCPEEGKARSCIASAWVGRQIGEAIAGPVQHGLLAGELLPPLHGDIDIGRVELDPARGAMRERIASLLGLEDGQVSVKRAGTGGLGALGDGGGMAAWTVVSLAEDAA